MEIDKNSLLYWYPKVKDLVRTPRTICYTNPALVRTLIQMHADEHIIPNGKADTITSAIAEITYKIRDLGTPFFMRTDQAAFKHSWMRTCYCEHPKFLLGHLMTLVEESIINDLPIRGFIFREFLKLDSRFEAFLSMPIAKEFRFFANRKGVLCVHPYWPAEAMEFHGNEPLNWRVRLAELSHLPENIGELKDMVIKAVEWSEDTWSIDLCMDQKKQWWLTDMALAASSFHWEGCPNQVLEEF
jgi:hypothetical protein